ncbi:hypothetical protein B0T26DRAFT_742778 [Lasiosphaeria miniovina]|uniref:Short-chain oxidoreductase n=1 Tax=Lasiosphaeria miniovina TaxID=1954250 RepID=A0AA40A4L6_9PEZI|nr:uncharacterized protein B0T26DRAFT_742778 [Lasiosphaeria miniovina]KAK0709226.1 hypothetical protein B0T26DRAFT_742778 [Lasiosphaeria miniovina]
MSAPALSTPRRPLTWLITGCSSGIGLSLARLVQARGHKLIATSRSPVRTPELVAEVERNGGTWLALDVTDRDSGRVVAELEHNGHQIDVLVNNAGGSIHAPSEIYTEDELRAQMDLLYFGPARLVRAVLPHMRQRRSGIVVNISTGAALEGRDSMGAYAAAKAALDAMSRVMAKEIAPFNVRLLVVMLGTFNTNMPSVAAMGATPLPDDYRGSVADQTMRLMSGEFQPDGDKDKAVRAVFDVVVGEGPVGTGREAERLLPLGRDMAARVRLVQDNLAHTMEVFGDVCNNVYIDGR